MRPTLETLFDTVSDELVRVSLSQEDERNRLRASLNEALVARGADVTIPDGQYADNLLMGLLALRVKFDRSEAMRKLEVNLSTRGQRPNRT